MALRFGLRIGLHRDGADLGLPVFETEMRRRLWWQVALLDRIAAERCGSRSSFIDTTWDSKLPLNVNDSELVPGMQEPPIEHEGSTEMLFCLLRYEIGVFWLKHKEFLHESRDHGKEEKEPTSAFDSGQKVLNELESLFERKYLRYCDPALPFHCFTSFIARASLCAMRLILYIGQSRMMKSDMPREIKDTLFDTAVRSIEYDNVGRTTINVKPYLWHIRMNFQWPALVFSLSELRIRPTGEKSDHAWDQLRQSFDNHPEHYERNSPLNVAIGNLALKAWAARLAQAPGSITPNFITILTKQRANLRKNSSRNVDVPPAAMPDVTEELPSTSYDTESSSFSNTMDTSPIDWVEWDNLMRDWELQTVEPQLPQY